jgi:hypothetical protein
MGEAQRRRQLGTSTPTHNQHAKWRRKERKLSADARLELCVHESATDGTFRRGEAFIAHEEAQAANEKRAPSKLKARLVREWKRDQSKRIERRRKQALKAKRAHEKAVGKVNVALAQSEAA